MSMQMQSGALNQANFQQFGGASPGTLPGLLQAPGQPLIGVANPMMANMTINQQVQDLLYKIQEQYFVGQQMQIAEMQRRRDLEEEMQMQDDCEPCPEIDEASYELFFEELSHEMKNKVKKIDQLKDSVRKERQGFISIVECIVKDTFSNRNGNGYVGIKIFGSMATELAIETSDVDLVVTGISTSDFSDHHGGYSSRQDSLNPKDQILKTMKILHDNLAPLKVKGQIQKIKFIQSATVPIIKLVADLQVINQIQNDKMVEEAREEREDGQGAAEVSLKSLGIRQNQIDQNMRFLKVDISIDEQSHLDMAQRVPGLPMLARSHSGIDTIYHIQNLVKNRKDLRPIVMIIKKIFDETFLSMPYFGGISSYSLVLMVAAYLKRFDEDNSGSLSKNMSGFFHFYGSLFKPQSYYLNGDIIVFCNDMQKRPF